MHNLDWLRRLRSQRRGHRGRHRPLHRRRPTASIEALEDRTLLAVFGSYNEVTRVATLTSDDSGDVIDLTSAHWGDDGRPTNISLVRVFGGGGNDEIWLAHNQVPYEIHMGSGDDLVVLGEYASIRSLAGGTGDGDVLEIMGFGRAYPTFDAQVTIGADSASWNIKGQLDSRIFVDRGFVSQFSGIEKISAYGTETADTINASAATVRVELYGGGGNDTLLGGSGNDWIEGGEGDDELLSGGEGNDVIFGQDGDDVISGDGGNDTINGGYGADTITGGAGNDRIFANGNGDSKSDSVDGGADNDHISTIFGDSYTKLTGGGGLDLLTIDETGTGGVFGNLAVTGSTAGLSIPAISSALATQFEALRILLTDGDGSRNVTIDNPVGIGYLEIRTGGGEDTIEVRGADFTAGAAEVRIESGAGKDTILLHAPNLIGEELEVVIEGEEGDDEFALFTGFPTAGPIYVDVIGGEGVDTLNIIGTDFADRIYLSQIEGDPALPDEDLVPGTYTPDLELQADELSTTDPSLDVREYDGFYAYVGEARVEIDMDGPDQLEKLNIIGGAQQDVIQGRIDRFDDGVILKEIGIYGGAGADVVTMTDVSTAALPEWLIMAGDAENDRLIGRDGKDELRGGDHDDLLIGNGGDDLLEGDKGQDILIGDGFDLSEQGWHTFEFLVQHLLNGGQNSIALSLAPEGTGEDTINGGAGDDFIIGGDAKDTIDAGIGNAIIFGDNITQTPLFSRSNFWESPLVFLDLLKLDSTLSGTGNDDITGSLTGSNIILGGDGNDTIRGSAAEDRWDFLFGNDGREVINGRDGKNIIVGGNNPNTGEKERLSGGGHFDLIFGDSISFSTESKFDLSGLLTSDPTLSVDLLAGFSLTGTGDDIILAGDGVNLVLGGQGEDEITGGTGAFDALFGNDGADKIHGLDGTNIIVGGDNPEGTEEILISGQDLDVILGDDLKFTAELSFDLSKLLEGKMPVALIKGVENLGSGRDLIQTGDGINFVWAGGGNDEVDGGEGALDVLFGNDGKDRIRGGNGVNFIVGGDNPAPEDGTDPAEALETLTGGDGLDIIIGDSLTLDLPDLDLPEANLDSITTFFRQSFALIKIGLADEGNDTIDAGNGLNLVLGGKGNDTIRGGTGIDLLYGNEGEDTIYGGAGPGVDLIIGGDDNDILYGHADDEQTNGDGANIIFGDNVALDVSFDLGFLAGEQSWPSLTAGIELDGSGWDFIYGSDEFDFLVGGDGRDTIEGRNGFNVVFGDDFSQATSLVNFARAIVDPIKTTELFGEALYHFAKDLIIDNVYKFFFGSEDDPDDENPDNNGDYYQGGDGVDLVFGGVGEDHLNGGKGFDILAGGGDNDTIFVGPYEGVPQGDWSNEWSSFGFGGPGEDLIFGGLGNDILGSTLGNDIIRGGGGNDVIVGGEDDDELYGEEGDDHLYGDAGNDLLDGGPGNDYLNGGPGDDTYVSDAGDEIVDEDDQEAASVQEVVINGGAAQRSSIETISVRFDRDFDAQSLIDSGEINDLIGLWQSGTTPSQLALSADRFRWDATTFTLTIDMTIDGFGGSSQTMLNNGRFRLSLDNGLDDLFADTDGLDDGLFGFDFHRLEGDYTGDGTVDALDQATWLDPLVVKIGARRGQPGYDAIYDLDGDGVISSRDYYYFSRQLAGQSV